MQVCMLTASLCTELPLFAISPALTSENKVTKNLFAYPFLFTHVYNLQ